MPCIGILVLKKIDVLILNKGLITIIQILKKREGGFRKLPGKALKNERTVEMVFVLPQG